MKKGKKLIQLIIAAVIAGALTGLSIAAKVFDSAEELFAGIRFDITALFRVAVMIAVVIAVYNALALFLSLFHSKKNRTNTLLTITGSILRYACMIFAVCVGLNIMGVNVSTIVASVGIVALIVGFGAESLIEDVITGFFMILEGQYNVGDIVEVNGFRGTVSSIGIRTTSITDSGGNVKIVNNSNMKDILNRSDKTSSAVAEIAVSYDVDLERLEGLLPLMMEGIYNLHTDIMKSEPVYLGVAELGASGVVLKFVAEVNESDIYKAQRVLNRELLVFFRKANIEIPFPRMDIHQV